MHTIRNAFVLCLTVVVSSCAKTPAGTTDKPVASVAAQPMSSAEAPAAPIDCPFHNAHAGHDGDGGHLAHGDMHRPFGDTQSYIDFLERADRASWQKPDQVVASLGLRPDDVVADVGAGSGNFSFRIAKQVPKGRVVALDIDPEMVRYVHHTALSKAVGNVVGAVAQPDDPRVPPEATVVFIADVLHHVAQRPAWLSRLHGEMKPAGRLFVIEFKEGELPQGPPAAMKLSRKQIEGEVTGAGFELKRVNTELLPYQLLFEFVRK